MTHGKRYNKIMKVVSEWLDLNKYYSNLNFI